MLYCKQKKAHNEMMEKSCVIFITKVFYISYSILNQDNQI